MLGLQSNNGLIDVLQNVHRLDPQYVERARSSPRTAGSSCCRRSWNTAPHGCSRRARCRACSNLLCDSFHYVILDVGTVTDPLAQEAFDHAARVYVVADRSVHLTRETIRLLRHIEDRDNNPPTSLLLNNPNAVTSGKVQPNDFMTATGRTVLYEIPFEAKALATAENLGEAPKEKAANGFNQMITRIGGDLTDQHMNAERSFFQKLRLRRG